MDRDVVAAMNISLKGRAFLSDDGTGKDVFERPKGLAGEAMKWNLGRVDPIIRRVDASKLSFRKKA
jgi:hypothetical protein